MNQANFRNIEIDGERYVLSESWYQTLKGLAAQAQDATLVQYPDCDVAINLYLVDAGQKIIATIKEVRHLLGLKLRDAKRFVDMVRDGKKGFLGSFPYEEARKINERFREAGARTDFPSPLEWLAQQA